MVNEMNDMEDRYTHKYEGGKYRVTRRLRWGDVYYSVNNVTWHRTANEAVKRGIEEDGLKPMEEW